MFGSRYLTAREHSRQNIGVTSGECTGDRNFLHRLVQFCAVVALAWGGLSVAADVCKIAFLGWRVQVDPDWAPIRTYLVQVTDRLRSCNDALLLLCGIALLRRWRWARRGLIIWAVVHMALVLLGTAVFWLPRPASLPAKIEWITTFSAYRISNLVAGLLQGLLFPVPVLWLMLQREVREMGSQAPPFARGFEALPGATTDHEVSASPR